MTEPFGDACDELLRKVDKLETANGKLCESVNQLTHMVETRDESIHNLVGLVDKRQAEIMKLTAERDELREKLSRALDNAHDTLTLVDLNGEVIS